MMLICITGSSIASIRDGFGHLGRIVDHHDLAGRGQDTILDRWSGDQQIQIILALQALAHDLHVQQAQETGAEAEAQRGAGLGQIRQRGIVELELFERVAQVGIVGRLNRIDAGEDHRLGRAIARQRLGSRTPGQGYRIADLDIADVLRPVAT